MTRLLLDLLIAAIKPHLKRSILPLVEHRYRHFTLTPRARPYQRAVSRFVAGALS